MQYFATSPFNYYLISAPLGISALISTTRKIPSFSADRIIPSLNSPHNLTGFKLATTATFLPTNSAGS